MADTIALEFLYDSVVQRFTDEAAGISCYFGWREPPRQLRTVPRIVWRPGDPSGTVGKHLPPQRPGQANPSRPLGTLQEYFTVEITAADTTALETEIAQWRAVRFVYDAWWRAVYLAAYGNVQIISLSWLTDKNERRHGATLRAVGAILSKIPDMQYTSAPVTTGAEIDAELLDATDELEFSPP